MNILCWHIWRPLQLSFETIKEWIAKTRIQYKERLLSLCQAQKENSVLYYCSYSYIKSKLRLNMIQTVNCCIKYKIHSFHLWNGYYPFQVFQLLGQQINTEDPVNVIVCIQMSFPNALKVIDCFQLALWLFSQDNHNSAREETLSFQKAL